MSISDRWVPWSIAALVLIAVLAGGEILVRNLERAARPDLTAGPSETPGIGSAPGPQPGGRGIRPAAGIIALVGAALAHAMASRSARLGAAVRELEGRLAQIRRDNLAELQRHQQTEAAMKRELSVDELTGLPGREQLLPEIARVQELSRGSPGHQVAVLFIGVDRFKKVNESLGAEAGDRVLAALASRLVEVSRSGDFVARVGGDRFVLLLDVESEPEADAAAQRIHHAVGDPLRVGPHEIFVSTSVGVAFVGGGVEKPEALLNRAEMAMHEAKSRGRDRTVAFHPDMEGRAGPLLQLESDLRRALDHEQLFLLYQPIVELVSQRIVGFEALARWNHPVDGIVPPIRFIPLAEDTGLIVPLTRWVLKETAAQLRRWDATSGSADLYVTVNLSFRDLDEADLCRFLADQLSGLPPRALRLEITERVLEREPELAKAHMAELHAAGVPLLLDDFGTGYSSLSSLHRFPFDFVKIDRSFVVRLGDGESAIVRAIIEMAHSIGLKLVAEGIETEAVAESLRALGCEYGQGYLYSKPVSAEIALSLVAGRPSRGHDDG